MRSLYQGEIDVFCAPYAVLNALRHLYGIRPMACRSLLHETLMYEAQDLQNWKELLDQKTDYCELVDNMLLRIQLATPLLVDTPFAPEATPDVSTLWQYLQDFLSMPVDSRVIVFQFIRYFPEDRSVDIKHWSCACTIHKESLVLFDSSRNEGALGCIKRTQLIPLCGDIQPGTVSIVPYSIRCLQRIRL